MNGEQEFIKKSYRSVALAWIIAMSWCIAFQKPWIALNITFGTALGTALLITYDRVIRAAFVPGKTGAKRALLKLALVKYPLIGIILYCLVRWDRFHFLAFCGGIILVHFAIVAKLASRKLVRRPQSVEVSLPAAGSLPDGKES
jgi:hypothetical protein